MSKGGLLDRSLTDIVSYFYEKTTVLISV